MNVCVFCGAHPGKEDFGRAAYELGKLIAQKGDRLIYGGSDLGLMGKVALGAKEAGGEIKSIIPSFFINEHGVNDPYSTERQIVSTMNERKNEMLNQSELFIALPGGIGTLDEIGDVLTQISLRLIKGRMILCDFDGFYEPLKAMIERMKQEGYIRWAPECDPIYISSVEEAEAYL